MKKYLIIIIIMACATFINAQNNSQTWMMRGSQSTNNDAWLGIKLRNPKIENIFWLIKTNDEQNIKFEEYRTTIKNELKVDGVAIIPIIEIISPDGLQKWRFASLDDGNLILQKYNSATETWMSKTTYTSPF